MKVKKTQTNPHTNIGIVGVTNSAQHNANVSVRVNLNETLKKLSQIVSWFELQTELDVEKGLENVKEGAALIKASRERLSEIENEFKEIKKEIQKP